MSLAQMEQFARGSEGPHGEGPAQREGPQPAPVRPLSRNGWAMFERYGAGLGPTEALSPAEGPNAAPPYTICEGLIRPSTRSAKRTVDGRRLAGAAGAPCGSKTVRLLH